MPIGESLLTAFVAKLSWQVIQPFLEYYNLKAYVTRILRRQTQTPERTIFAYSANRRSSGEELFWHDVIRGSISEGNSLLLRDFQLSPWFPRKPGVYWTERAHEARQEAFRNHVESAERGAVVFDLYGKTLMAELGGIGTVNLRKDRDNVLVTATASGQTHQGVPLLCSSTVWDSLRTSLAQDNMVEMDVRGEIVSIPSEFDSSVLRSPGVPRIALSVESVLDVKPKVSRLPITVTPWTIFETRNRRHPFGFTYVTHRLLIDDIANSVRWLLDYIDSKQGTTILTDFDELTSPLNARFPLGACFEGTITTEQVIQYCQAIDRHFARR